MNLLLERGDYHCYVSKHKPKTSLLTNPNVSIQTAKASRRSRHMPGLRSSRLGHHGGASTGVGVQLVSKLRLPPQGLGMFFDLETLAFVELLMSSTSNGDPT